MVSEGINLPAGLLVFSGEVTMTRGQHCPLWRAQQSAGMAGRPLVETEAKCGLTVSTSLRPSLVHLRVYCSNCTVAGNGSNQQEPFCSPGGYKMLSVGQ